MKKTLALISAACVALTSTLTSFAATAPTTRAIPSVDCYEGGTFSISICANIKDLSGLHLTFKYDKSKLRYTGQETKMGHGDAVDDGETLEWSTMLNPNGETVSYDDVIATLNFEVIESFSESDRCVEYGVAEAYDVDMKDVDFDKLGAFELISDGSIGLIGDLDSDKTITTSDALAILRSSMKPEELDRNTFTICDVNYDHIIDASDALDVLRASAELPTSSSMIGKPILAGASKLVYLDTI